MRRHLNLCMLIFIYYTVLNKILPQRIKERIKKKEKKEKLKLYFTRKEFHFFWYVTDIFIVKWIFYTKPNHLVERWLSGEVNNTLRDAHWQGDLLSTLLKVNVTKQQGQALPIKEIDCFFYFHSFIFEEENLSAYEKPHRNSCWITQRE